MTKDSQPNGTPEVVRAEVVDMAARPASMPKRDAVKLTNSIKKTMDYLEDRREALQALVDQAYRGKAWAAMGYASWSQYTTQEFQMSRARSYQLVNWAELNRELEAEGLPPVTTEREARRTRKTRNAAKSATEESQSSPVGDCLPVDSPAPLDQPERAPDIAESVEEQPRADSAAIPATTSAPDPAIPGLVARAFPVDSETAAEALVGCRPAEARSWDPLLFPRLESWVAQVAAILQPQKVKAAPKPAVHEKVGGGRDSLAPRTVRPGVSRNACTHKDAAGKETVNKLPYGVFCAQCNAKVR